MPIQTYLFDGRMLHSVVAQSIYEVTERVDTLANNYQGLIGSLFHGVITGTVFMLGTHFRPWLTHLGLTPEQISDLIYEWTTEIQQMLLTAIPDGYRGRHFEVFWTDRATVAVRLMAFTVPTAAPTPQQQREQIQQDIEAGHHVPERERRAVGLS